MIVHFLSLLQKKEMISIIVPVYNAARYLHRCVNSVLSQSYTDWELLLVDDGSTDESGIICDEYASQDQRIRVFHKSNEGASDARNYGILRASGKYSVFIDADDWVGSDYLKVMYDTAVKYYGSLVMQGLVGIRGIEKSFLTMPGTVYGVRQRDKFFEDINVFRFCGSCCKLFDTEVLKTTLYDKNIIAAEDYDLFVRYLTKMHSDIVTLIVCEYYYENHDGSVSTRLYGFEKELSGLRVLDNTFQEYIHMYGGDNAKLQFDEMLGYYTERVLATICGDKTSHSSRIAKMKTVGKRYWMLSTKYNKKTSFFFRVLKFMLSKGYMRIADILISVYQLKSSL
ncbi:glycosyltransferase [Bacteroides acidifaciens]|uniref:glycosyltransferase family 2 protein n=2 Tax=Bacteroidales TaxID=171549 RepID=UPI002583A358|nr:glycosyltransferase [Bacteroides acidifaciens]